MERLHKSVCYKFICKAWELSNIRVKIVIAYNETITLFTITLVNPGTYYHINTLIIICLGINIRRNLLEENYKTLGSIVKEGINSRGGIFSYMKKIQYSKRKKCQVPLIFESHPKCTNKHGEVNGLSLTLIWSSIYKPE